MANKPGFKLSIEEQIGVITIDVPDESQNVLKASFIDDVSDILDTIESADLRGVIITSGKPDTFIAGADIKMLKSLDSREAIERVASAGYAIFNRIEQFPIPVVVEVHGPCIGGGLELSLACHGRVASRSEATRFALPEVQIGLLPGGGGTQRLPALIGVADALMMMTTGRQIQARKALSIGLIDKLVERSHLRQASIDLIDDLAAGRVKRDELSTGDWKKPARLIKHLLNRYLIKLPPVQNFIFSKARQQVQSKTRGKYPAPTKIIDCVEAGISSGKTTGFETEAREFANLILSPEAFQLMNLFFAITDLKKERFIKGRTKPRAVHRLGIVGGGLMGSGIALVSAQKAKVGVRVQEVDHQSLDRCLQYSWRYLQAGIKKRKLKPIDARTVQNRISGTLDYTGFGRTELVIEAAYESLEVKHQVIRDIEAHAPRDVIIATNTSSIPITDIAKAAKKPQNVIGMHYFSPVEKMPLLEIIRTEQTSDKAVITAVEFGRQQGKTVIVVSDGAGFYTSRILAAYMNEAAQLLSEGVSIDRIDKAMLDFGFPVGPFTLLDEVGIDVATKIMPVLEEAFGERLKAPACFHELKNSSRLGKKDQRGFYDYSHQGKGPRPVDATVYQELGITPDNDLPEQQIQERCHLMMLNEAARCLEEGILSSARDGDIGAIFGLGYPPFLGGPFRYMDRSGASDIQHRLTVLQESGLSRFEPANIICSNAQEERRYY